jgi:hypothetical protein
MRRIIGAGIAVFAIAMLILVTQLGTGDVRADVDPATIDFETGLSEGDTVSSVSCGSGMTCTADPGGSVGVFGDSADAGIPGNAAMIFDAECAGGCSGGDDDLNFPGHGNILIITEDEDASDPDDADLVNAFFEFDFSTWGPGTVCVDSIDVGDVEAKETGAKVELFPGPTIVNVPDTGDNVIVTQAINVCGVTSMRVTLNGSGAIDNIAIELENGNGGGEGCTPGFWKNHEADWVGFSPGDSFESIFGRDAFTGDPSLLQVMNLKGGGLNRLSAHAVAALLNASHPNVDYDLTPTEVIADWQAAFDAGGSAINTQKDIFVAFNELGCDVNNG